MRRPRWKRRDRGRRCRWGCTWTWRSGAAATANGRWITKWFRSRTRRSSTRKSEWTVDYEVVPVEDPALVDAEVCRQLDRFRALVGREPTHLDSHQHVHRQGPAHQVMTQLARQL